MALACIARAEQSPEETAEPVKEISFQRDVEPIFSRHCYGCHQGAKQLGSYLMTDFTALIAGGESEQVAIVPGKPEESYLIDLITPVDGHAEMPDEPFEALNETEIGIVRSWIAQPGRFALASSALRSCSLDGDPPRPVGVRKTLQVSPTGASGWANGSSPSIRIVGEPRNWSRSASSGVSTTWY